MKKILQWSMIGVLSVGGLAACGSDKKNDTVTTTADSTAASTDVSTAVSTDVSTAVSTDVSTATADSAAGDGVAQSDTVTEFCAKTEALGTDYAANQTGSVSSSVVADITARAVALGEELKADIIASPADKDALVACLAAVKTAGG